MGTTCRVATTMKVEKLIREMGGSSMMGITECKLLADGRTWSPVQTFRLDDDNVQKTVEEMGWTESRRVNGPPVWICPFHPGLEEKRRSGILAPTGISFIIKQEAIGILRAHARISTHHSAHTSISNCFPVLLSNNLEWPRVATKIILFHCIEVRLYSVDELRCPDAWDPKADSMSSSNSPARRFLVQLTTYVVVCIGILPAHLSAGLQGAREQCGYWCSTKGSLGQRNYFPNTCTRYLYIKSQKPASLGILTFSKVSLWAFEHLIAPFYFLRCCTVVSGDVSRGLYHTEYRKYKPMQIWSHHSKHQAKSTLPSITVHILVRYVR